MKQGRTLSFFLSLTPPFSPSKTLLLSLTQNITTRFQVSWWQQASKHDKGRIDSWLMEEACFLGMNTHCYKNRTKIERLGFEYREK